MNILTKRNVKDLLLNGKREVQLRMYGMISFLKQNILPYRSKFLNKHVLLLPLWVLIFKDIRVSYRHYKDSGQMENMGSNSNDGGRESV